MHLGTIAKEVRSNFGTKTAASWSDVCDSKFSLLYINIKNIYIDGEDGVICMR